LIADAAAPPGDYFSIANNRVLSDSRSGLVFRFRGNFLARHWPSGLSPRWLSVESNQAFAMTVASAPKAPVSEDTLIDALRGCENLQQLLLLRDQLAKDPSNPQLFDWVCSLLVHRSVSRGLAARVLQQLHHHPLA